MVYHIKKISSSVKTLSDKQQPSGSDIQDDTKSKLGCTDCISEMDRLDRSPEVLQTLYHDFAVQSLLRSGSEWHQAHKMAAPTSLHLCRVGSGDMSSISFTARLGWIEKRWSCLYQQKGHPSNRCLCCYYAGNWLQKNFQEKEKEGTTM